VAFSPDGLWPAVAPVNQPIKLEDVTSGEVVRAFDRQADNAAFGIVFSPDGKLLAAGGLGGTVRSWDVQRGKLPARSSMAMKWRTRRGLFAGRHGPGIGRHRLRATTVGPVQWTSGPLVCVYSPARSIK
jgi:WD40 repeat protein